MRIGPTWWHCVDVDTIGVPHGGAYGDLDWFRREAGLHGLHVAWNWMRRSFGVYTTLHGKYTWQLTLRKGDGVLIPMDGNLLNSLIYLWDQHAKWGTESIMLELDRLDRERMAQVARERYEELSSMDRDVEKETNYAMGKTRPVTIILPRRLERRAVRAGQRRRRLAHAMDS